MRHSPGTIGALLAALSPDVIRAALRIKGAAAPSWSADDLAEASLSPTAPSTRVLPDGESFAFAVLAWRAADGTPTTAPTIVHGRISAGRLEPLGVDLDLDAFARTTPGPPTRVALVDVDGVVAPSTFVLVELDAAWQRIMPPHTIAVLNELCCRTGARIVMNTTHNEFRRDVPDIVDAMVAHGLHPHHVHPTDRKTRHPAIGRHDAVLDWLARHPEVSDWVAFDDEAFADIDQLVRVDPDSGLTTKHLNVALARFGQRPVGIIM